MTRAAAISLDEAGASLGRGSVRLHAQTNIVIGTTAASRRYHEYGCIGKGARSATGASDRAHIRLRVVNGPETRGRHRWYYAYERLVFRAFAQ